MDGPLGYFKELWNGFPDYAASNYASADYDSSDYNDSAPEG